MPSAKTSKKETKTTTPVEQAKESKTTTPVEQAKESKPLKKEMTTTATTATTAKVTKTTKAKKTDQTKTEQVPEKTTTTTPEVENVVVVTDSTASVNQGFTDFIAKFQTMLSQFSNLRTELKTLERHTVKQMKIVEKLNNKKKRGAKRKPSGFVKPAPISEELATFLGKEKGVEMARTEVTREINQYIRTHNLQDKENGRKINPDTALSNLLKITPESDVVLTYFNLQRYMGPHFPKAVKVETA
jgi:upstream activation factor subunit UAF30